MCYDFKLVIKKSQYKQQFSFAALTIFFFKIIKNIQLDLLWDLLFPDKDYAMYARRKKPSTYALGGTSVQVPRFSQVNHNFVTRNT